MGTHSVVTCFITRSRDSGTELLLLKRSSRVHTYQSAWAGISGSIEPNDPSPEFRAYKELFEETQLEYPLVKLALSGPPLNFIDEELGTKWEVHPFLFTTPREMEEEMLQNLKIDWEHTEFKWIKPEEITNHQTVPNLEKAWKRVWLRPTLRSGLAQLKEDHVSGARELARKGLEILKGFLNEDELRRLDIDGVWEHILADAWHIAKNGRPAMGAAIESAILSSLEEIQGIRASGPSSVEDFLRSASEVISSRIQQESTTLDTLCNHFAGYFMLEATKSLGCRVDTDGNGPCHGIHILTLSDSSTLFNCLLCILTNPELPAKINLTVLESRPLNEGVSLAAKLLQKLPRLSRLSKLEIASDASVAQHLSSTTHVLLGADKIYPHGHVWNKTGSLAMVLLAKQSKVPVVVVTQTNKVVIKSIEDGITEEENDPAELSAAWGEEVRKIVENDERVYIRNNCFELVRGEFIDVYITENGVTDAGYMAVVGERRQELERSLFRQL